MALDKYDEDFASLQEARNRLNSINLRRYRAHAPFREAVQIARSAADDAFNALIEVEQAEEAKLDDEGGRDG